LYKKEAQWMRSLATPLNKPTYFYGFIRIEAFKKFQFNREHDSLKTDEARRWVYYPMGMQEVNGGNREQFLAYLLTSQTIKEIGFIPETERLLNDYYAMPGDDRYKEFVREYERKRRNLLNARRSPDFQLTDIHGQPFTNNSVKGKIVVMDFW